MTYHRSYSQGSHLNSSSAMSGQSVSVSGSGRNVRRSSAPQHHDDRFEMSSSSSSSDVPQGAGARWEHLQQHHRQQPCQRSVSGPSSAHPPPGGHGLQVSPIRRLNSDRSLTCSDFTPPTPPQEEADSSSTASHMMIQSPTSAGATQQQQQQQRRQQQQQAPQQVPAADPQLTPEETEEALELEDQLVAMLRMESSYTTPASSTVCRLLRPAAVLPETQRSPTSVASLHKSHAAADAAAAAANGNGGSNNLPHDEWRRKICEWSYKVVDHFRFDREVVSVAMNYFDRFLAKTGEDESFRGSGDRECSCPACLRAVDSRTFQLAAMTALYLAIKCHAESGVDDYEQAQQPELVLDSDGMQITPRIRRKRRKLKLSSFVELSRGQFGPEDIVAMESNMLSALRWRVNPPTPMAMVTYFLRLFPARVPAAYHRPHSPPPNGFGTPLSSRRRTGSVLRRHYDLVLHVLHELSRYLTELSVCLTDVSTARNPSAVTYASVLISMDMLTEAALPQEVREDFNESVAWVSRRAYTDSSDLDGALHPDDEDVRFLKGRIRRSFLPEMLLDNASGGMDDEEEGTGGGGGQHPIAIARDAGLLDLDNVYSHGDSSTASPSSWGDVGMERGHGRKGSATSVLDGNNETDRALSQHQQQQQHHHRRTRSGLASVTEESPVCVSKGQAQGRQRRPSQGPRATAAAAAERGGGSGSGGGGNIRSAAAAAARSIVTGSLRNVRGRPAA